MLKKIEDARKWLKGKKTYVLAITGAVGIVMAWAAGDISGMEMFQQLWGMGIVATFRAAIG